jgi:hypothetical protein
MSTSHPTRTGYALSPCHWVTLRIMKHITPLLLCGFLLGCDRRPVVPQGGLTAATNRLAQARTPQERFYALNDAAKQSFVAGDAAAAKMYAQELMSLLPKYPNDWNYWNAVQDGNIVLGRIAVKEGRVTEAKQHLLAAGNSPGSSQMKISGPNMSLAKDLLEKGEREVVIQYLELCRRFWNTGGARLNRWRREIDDGKIPGFGENPGH